MMPRPFTAAIVSALALGVTGCTDRANAPPDPAPGREDATSFDLGVKAWSVAAGNFDSDDQLDLAVSTANRPDPDDPDAPATKKLLIFGGNGNGRFFRRLALPGGLGQVVAADFNGDGQLDLAVSDALTGSVHIFVRDGEDAFIQQPALECGIGARWLAVGEFNADTLPDLAVSSTEARTISIFVGVPAADGEARFNLLDELTIEPEPTGVAVGDLDGDGLDDIVAAAGPRRDTPVELFVWRQDRAGVFAGPSHNTVMPAGFSAGIGSRAVAISDLDQDRRPDLVVADYFSDYVSIHRGIGEVGEVEFARPVGVPFGPGDEVHPFGLTTADLDGDCRSDVVVTTVENRGVTVLLSRPDGSLARGPAFSSVGEAPVETAVGLFDGDLVPDVAAVGTGLPGDTLGTLSIFPLGEFFDPPREPCTTLRPDR